LASVPGTEQAAEAVVLAEMPHTARVNVKELKAPDVNYEWSAAVSTYSRDDADQAMEKMEAALSRD
jgi:hypothetical protein